MQILVQFKIFLKLNNYYNKKLKFEKDTNIVDRRLITLFSNEYATYLIKNAFCILETVFNYE